MFPIFTQIKKEILTMQQIIEKINDYAKSKIPFLLFVDFEMQKPLLYKIDALEKENITISFPRFSNKKDSEKKEIELQNVIPIEKEIYKKGFDIVMQNLMYGNSYLTNFTAKTAIETKASMKEIFDNAKAKYKIKYKEEWLCFSPECFIKIEGNEIYSFPMKGTIDASISDAENILLKDKKEIAEHYTIVDLIRNDLSMIAKNVCVEKFRYLDKIHSNNKTLLQVSSKIKGELSKDFKNNLGEILFQLLPAGSISGAPKKKTIEIIATAENDNRGYYTGVAFYFDGQNIDSCVMIRFIEKKEDKMYYRSGGGITINSILENEYQELKDKIYVPLS